MKTLTLLLLLISFAACGQANYLLIYKEEPLHISFSGYITLTTDNTVIDPIKEPQIHYDTIYRGFKTLDALQYWLNTSRFAQWNSDKNKNVYIDEEDIISILDIRSAKPINFKLKVERKSKPRQVIIEKEEWIEKEYILYENEN